MNKKVMILSGGVGGAKLALGMHRILPPEELTVVVNTGDDFDHLGLRICPDIDTTLYTLGNVANNELGWGREKESWYCLDTLTELGGEAWFRLGDKDLALHLLRTQALNEGKTLSQFTAKMASKLGINSQILPMSNQHVATELLTDEGRLPFQQYFVKQQCQPAINAIEYTQAETAQPLPEVTELLQSNTLQAIIIAPSNPFLSIEPILAIAGMRSLLQQANAPIIAVSPIIGDAAVKGPTAKIMRELAYNPSALGVLEYYGDLLDGFIFDSKDAHLQSQISIANRHTQTLMQSLQDREQLAIEVLAFAKSLATHKIEAIV